MLEYAAPTRPRCSAPITATDFFKDTPWFNIPTERKGRILLEPLYPQGGLLGGSGKPSKLAALAAARRKATQEDKSTGAALAPQDAKAIAETVPRLANMSIEPSDPAVVAIQLSPPIVQYRHISIPSNGSGQKPGSDTNDTIETVAPAKEYLKTSREHVGCIDIQAPPSAFAKTMLGAHAERVTEDNTHSSRYFSLPSNTDNNTFTGPSPDDVVLKAQAKGSVR